MTSPFSSAKYYKLKATIVSLHRQKTVSIIYDPCAVNLYNIPYRHAHGTVFIIALLLQYRSVGTDINLYP